MKIFGHPWIDDSVLFCRIGSQKEIKSTLANSIVWLEPLPLSLDLAKYCQRDAIPYAISVETIKDAIFANLLGAKYALCNRELAVELMPIAQNYLFDMQILAKIEDSSQIEEMAKANVDGVIVEL